MATNKQRKSKKAHNANGIMPKKQTPRRRIQFKFWLDDYKPDEQDLGIELDKLKGKRQFAATIRNALKVFLALMVGDILPLCSFFPLIVEMIQQQGRAALEAQHAGLLVENEALRHLLGQQEQRIAELEAQLSTRQPASVDFEAMLQGISAKLDTMQTGTKTVPNQPPNSTDNQVLGLRRVGSPVALPAPQFEVPVYNENEDTGLFVVNKDEQAGQRSAQHFMDSLLRTADLQPDPDSPRYGRGR